MALQSAKDIPLRISSLSTASERRVTPSWTLAQLKTRLEPITGIPASYQRVLLKNNAGEDTVLESSDENKTLLSSWNLRAYAEIYVDDTRPAAARGPDFNDVSSVEKYTMPEETYAGLTDSVLAWKKNNKLGRFDPKAPEIERQKMTAYWSEIEAKGIALGKRCRVGPGSVRRGEVSYVGEVVELPGVGGPWVGIILDEPTGKNDGSIGGKEYFQCEEKRGIFVRPERVEVGDFGNLIDEEDDEMEEL